MQHVTTLSAAIALLLVLPAQPAHAQPPQASSEPGTAWTSDRGEWMPLPDIFPKGGQMKVIHGDPAKGPSDLYFRFPAGYGVPWHFHTPVEKVFVDQGAMEFEMRGDKKVSLKEGGYVRFPKASPHKATCSGSTDCLFLLSSDGPFDIHLVDENTWKTTRSWRAGGPVGTTGQQ